MKSKLKVLLKLGCGNELADVLNVVILPQTSCQPKTRNPETL